jgi:hypothetical protein
MKPGDLIERVYEVNPQPVKENEKLWSTPMSCWVPISIQPAVLISITDEFYVWLNTKGLFNARIKDTAFRSLDRMPWGGCSMRALMMSLT